MKLFAAFIILTLSAIAQGFLQEFTPKNQALTKYPHPRSKDFRSQHTEALVGQELEVRLEIGQKSSAQMSIQQLLVHLDEKGCPLHKTATGTRSVTTIGKSSLCHSMTVAKTGNFITHSGLQEICIDPSTAVWELLWDKQDSPAGTLVLGLDVEQDAIRNDAKLKKGHIFISFGVWKKDSLKEYQERKASCEEAAAVHLRERDVQLQKYKEANNIISKLIHYRNTAAAVEQYSLYPVRSLAKVPDDKDLIPLNEALFLTRTGTVWRPEGQNNAFSSRQPVPEGSVTTIL
jgi:hypothetical protein